MSIESRKGKLADAMKMASVKNSISTENWQPIAHSELFVNNSFDNEKNSLQIFSTTLCSAIACCSVG